MKFKKAFSVILAVAMVITLMPSMAFATTTNRPVTTPNVKADAVFGTGSDVVVTLENTSGVAITNGTIGLKLTNATFEEAGGKALGDSDADLDTYMTLSDSSANAYDLVPDVLDDSYAKFTFNSTTATTADGEKMTLTIDGAHIKAGSEAGPIILSIDGDGSMISSGDITIATVGSGRTVTSVIGKVNSVTRKAITSEADILIEEIAVNSIDSGVKRQVIRMSLPKGCTWNGLDVSGSAAGGTTVSYDNPIIGTLPAFDGSTTANLYLDSASSRIAYAVIDTDGNYSTTGKETLKLTPKYTIGKDTPAGDITVEVAGYGAYGGNGNNAINDETVTIAYYGDENVSVYASEAEKLPTIIAGKTDNNKSKDFKVRVTLKENIKGALSAGRYVDFDFPEEIQVKAVKYVVSKNEAATANAFTGDAAKYLDLNVSKDKDASGFTFLVPETADAADLTGWDVATPRTITFEIAVTVEAGYEGDIVCSVSGAKAGVENTEVVVGKAITPITVKTETTNVKNGIQRQIVSDITITENLAGYIKDSTGDSIVLGIDSLGLLSGMSIDDFESVAVTEGNIEIGKVSINTSSAIADAKGDCIIIPVKSYSTTPSTIEIKGVTINLNRTLPEGGYDLLIGGKSLVDNTDYNAEDFSDCAAVVTDYVKIVTPAESGTIENKIDAKFVIGQSSYTNNGTAVSMDAAAYIDGNNRTMVPIRYIANACGVNDDNITWDQATQTATINGANNVVRVTMGDYTIRTSSSSDIYMDTVAVNNNGRIYVPARYIANALGAEVAWDHATQTVTITK